MPQQDGGENMSAEKSWFVYILRCADGTLYTGMTDDPEQRLEAHNAGKGAKYTRGRGPVDMVYRECCKSRSDALKRECAIKKMTRKGKNLLIESSSQ